MDFSNKIVWITGASSGIGEALALAFVACGATVIASSRSKEKLEAIKMRSTNPERFYPVTLDLTDSDLITRVADKVITQFGHIDILINNAGISQRAKVQETSIATDRYIMEVNYFSAVILTKAVLPTMLASGSGYILSTSSIVGVFGFPLRSAYSAAKHALHGFFESLRAEYWNQGIKVSIIIGGRINTPISMSAIAANGMPYGRMDEGQLNGITPDKAVRQIFRGMRRGKHEIMVGGKELLMVRIKRLFPGLHFRIARKIKST